MEPAHSIRKLGFRKWYERRLLEGHGWLVVALLCGLVLALSLELASFHQPPALWLGNAALAFIAGLAACHGLRRFFAILRETQHLGAQSTCKSCRKYAAFTVIAESPRTAVRCRKCGHEWMFD